MFVFDLNPANDAVTYVGEYRMFMLDDTSSASNQYTESPAVSFDQSTGLRYVFHGEIPMLTVHDLSSQPVAGQTYRLLGTLRTFHGPNESNPDYEGLALTPIGECVGGMRSVFMTVDGSATSTRRTPLRVRAPTCVRSARVPPMATSSRCSRARSISTRSPRLT